ncbi:hypothetical protein H4S06_004075 [Coemansia sp. BCRC 34490]|nr:hypothetical protein H4S06_004075 [Coemansia sp. BCRC 34490]
MVKDYGGLEKADWKAISKVAGLTERECLGTFRRMFVPTRRMTYWTRDEEDRLVQSLRKQRQYWDGTYSWVKAAIDIGKFTNRQCHDKFYNSVKIRKAVEQPRSNTLPSTMEE